MIMEPIIQMERSDKKRKLDHIDAAGMGVLLETLDQMEVGWHALQPILENDVLRAKIPSPEMAFSLLVRWFRIIVRDQEKLRLFRQWVIPSSEPGKLEIDDERTDCNTKLTTQSPSSSSASSSSSFPNLMLLADSFVKKNLSIDGLIHDNDSRNRLSNQVCSSSNNTNGNHHQVLLQQLLQQQQQQIVLLQQLQQQSPTSSHAQNYSSLTAQGIITNIFPKSGGTGSVLNMTMKGGRWHPHTGRCECKCIFTGTNGTTVSSQRISGGGEGELRFIVPAISTTTLSTQMPVVLQLSLCSSPDSPIVCLEPFLYAVRPHTDKSLGSSQSDEDSEEMAEEAAIDEDERDDEEDGSSPPRALPPLDTPTSMVPTPKQLMTIRERMLEHIQRGSRGGGSRLTVLQQPSVRVVWKNRRLDTPFKIRVECLEDTGAGAFNPLTPSKLIALAVVADHKGRLQIDAAENFTEEFTSQGLAHFANLRMTKGTWGKEWTITFVAVLKATLNNPVIAAVSTSCPIVVKTRKNPQIRHSTGSLRAESPPSPVLFVERKSTSAPATRPKRHRVEDLLDHRPSTPPNSGSTTSSHSEDMDSLLYAAELKQQEQLQEQEHEHPNSALTVHNSGHSDHEYNFSDFQSLVSFLEDVRTKRQISLSITEQPQPKRDSKVLIVKKGKPFRIPFRLQLRASLARHNPQQYVCVAVVRNDKGEDVAVRNSEVPFDSRGVACFAGLMVMKGTWGKTVQLSFEARWATRRMGSPPWGSQRMLVVAETSPFQLMCYTKDKKNGVIA